MGPDATRRTKHKSAHRVLPGLMDRRIRGGENENRDLGEGREHKCETFKAENYDHPLLPERKWAGRRYFGGNR